MGRNRAVTAGYSGTPLVRKMGIAPRTRVALLDEPDGFRELLEPLPEAVRFTSSLRASVDVVVLFATERAALVRRLPAAARAIFPDGALWVAWPKRAAKVPTDITEDVVRAVILPAGLVDTKVCAIDSVWSGLKVVHRRERRTAG